MQLTSQCVTCMYQASMLLVNETENDDDESQIQIAFSDD